MVAIVFRSHRMKLSQVLEALKRAAMPSRRAWSIAHDIDPAHVARVLAEKEPPGPRVLAALELERMTTITYRRLPKARSK